MENREIVVGDVSICDEYEVSNVTNDYFSIVGVNLSVEFRGEIEKLDSLQYLEYKTQYFPFSDVSVDSVCKVITNLIKPCSTTMFDVITERLGIDHFKNMHYVPRTGYISAETENCESCLCS